MKLCAILAIVVSVHASGSECDAAPAEVDDEVTLLSIRASVSQRAATNQAADEEEGAKRRRRRSPDPEPEPDEDLEVRSEFNSQEYRKAKDWEQFNALEGWERLAALEKAGWEEVHAIDNNLDEILFHSARACEPAALEKCEEHTPCIDLHKSGNRNHVMWLDHKDGTAKIREGRPEDHRSSYTCTREHLSEEAEKDERQESCQTECDNQRQDAKSECKELCRERNGQSSLVGTWNCPHFSGGVITIASDYADGFTSTRDTDSIKVCALGQPIMRRQLDNHNEKATVVDARFFESAGWEHATRLEHKLDEISFLLGGVPKPHLMRTHQFKEPLTRELDASDLQLLQDSGNAKLSDLCAKLFALSTQTTSVVGYRPRNVCGVKKGKWEGGVVVR